MYSVFRLGLKYIRYYFSASNGKGHGMHSPFIFDFITKVMNDKRDYPAYSQVEKLRKQLLKDHAILVVQDFGAGSAVDKTNHRSIRSVAKNAAKPARFGQLLFRMVRHYQPKILLELGTSLGITTSYLSLAEPGATITSMEGSDSILEKASQNFTALNLQNISICLGNFDQTLPDFISKQTSIDFVFIDGNHRREPTERYFTQLLPVIHNDSILIFDDIHWSAEMDDAWKTIQQHPSVRCTIDLFFIGIVLFRKEFKEKQHFVIRF